MKKLIPILFAVFAFAACEKDPDYNKLSDDYTVYTSYDKSANFAAPTKFYLPDNILIIDGKNDSNTESGENAQTILNAVAKNMTDRGYVMTETKDEANLGVQVSYVKNTYYFTDYGYPEWGWGPGGYWPNYWGNYWGGGYYYPYSISYALSTNSYMVEVVNLDAKEGTTEKLPVWWTAYLVGPSYTGDVNAQFVVKGINQAFAQSPYLKK